MDLQRLITVLRGSFNPDPTTQKQAETTLSEMHKIISFTPSLLQVINSPDTAVDMATRQAAAIYLKNTIAGNWEDRADGDRFSIHEQDRHTIRENIIDCIVAAPDPLRVQLASCVQNILKHDFPGRWTDVCDRISTHLSIPTNDADKAVAMRRWSGALIVLYRLVKNYEYKKHEERGPLTDTMRVMLPYLHERMLFIMPFQEQEAVFAQKMIIKILFALIQFSFRVDLMPQELFMSWMDILRQIVERPVPDCEEGRATASSSFMFMLYRLNMEPEADNATKKKALRVRIDEYMQRAEVLKAKLDAKQAEGRYHEQLQIPAGAQGFGYERVFQPFIDEKLAHVEVEDPYVRASHQVLNFVRFCEVLVKLAKSLQTIHLKTGRHESQEARATQARALSELATDLAERRNVQLSFEFSDVMHDREIRFSTGWVVKIGRGLDYFRPPVSKYSIGAFDLSLRPCHETTVDIFHAKNVKVTHSAQ